MSKKIVLTAINAKYIHSNLAVYSLKAYAQPFCDTKKEERKTLEIAEYTINQQVDDILRDIYRRNPDMLFFSCYIWNISHVEIIIKEIAKIRPELSIWLGGPEVSYDAKEVLERLPEIQGVMKGEGEETFTELVLGKKLEKIKGITYRDEEKNIVEQPFRKVMDLSEVPFVYEDMRAFKNKIIYYESSRGCPFSCSYCLSSVDKTLRFRDIELVKKELLYFMEAKVSQVKFVDRTFNCNHEHAIAVWKFLKDNDNGVTNFHFEISADLLNKEELALIQSMRPGLIQLEIGVQSTNPDTIHEIRRSMKFDKVAKAVEQVKRNGNVHQHLDLIAGLPFEGIKRFQESFEAVYRLRPEQLQLGFLKVLKGSYMEEKKDRYELLYKSTPPYEVLSTKWLTYEDILQLKGVEEMVEIYYNSGQFNHTIKAFEREFTSAFAMYQGLYGYYEKHKLQELSHSRASRYQILLAFAEERVPNKKEYYQELLTYDYYLRENAKTRPAFAGAYKLDKEEVRLFYEQARQKYLGHYGEYSNSQIRKMTHLEWFETRNKKILFDYKNKNPLTKEAKVVEVE